MNQQEELHQLKKSDRAVASLAGKIRATSRMIPTNIVRERRKFLRDASYNPQFEFPSVDQKDLDLVQSKAPAIDIPGSDYISSMIRERRDRLLDYIDLLNNHDADSVTEHSDKIYGFPQDHEVERAKHILQKHRKIKATRGRQPREKWITGEEAARRIEEALYRYGVKNWTVEFRRKRSARLSIRKKGIVYVSKKSKFKESEMDSAIAHEIGVHILRTENGKKQPLKIFKSGAPHYLATEEGLASLAGRIYRRSNLFSNIALSLIAVDFSKTHSFAETFKELHENWEVDAGAAWRYTLRSKRGIADTSQPGAHARDAAYLRGVFQINSFLDSGGDLRDLYIGKVSVEDVKNLEGNPHIVAPKYFPVFLEERLRDIQSILRANT